jgi:hypothetical protein
MNELKLLPAPKSIIVHGVNTTTGIRYTYRPLSQWFSTEFNAVRFVVSVNTENEATAACERLNANAVTVHHRRSHPPRIIPTTTTAHVAMSKERYKERYPDRLW